MGSNLDMTVVLGLVVSRGLLLASIKNGGNAGAPIKNVGNTFLTMLSMHDKHYVQHT